MSILRGYIVPGRPHPLLCPERAEPWQRLRDAFVEVREEIQQSGADVLLLYSTQWLSVIGHQIQADPEPEWTLVDQEWHELGEMPYRFRMDADFAHAYQRAAAKRGLHARTVAYHGFPIDTGTVVALKLLDPDNRIPACVVSCNMYADRAETLVLGKAARDALRAQNKKAVAIGVTALSNRMFTRPIEPEDDRISSVKDDEWNRKLLEILAEGRLEDVAQHAREFTAQANGDQKLKAVWWLAALMGQHNDFEGQVFEYQPLVGTGAALVGLTPSADQAADLEFDEEDVEVFTGDREVLSDRPADPSVRRTRAAEPRSEREGLSSTVGLGGFVAPRDAEEAGADAPFTGPSGEGTEAARDEADTDAETWSVSFSSDDDGTSVRGTISSSASSEDDRPARHERGIVHADSAPRPVGAFPHARKVGQLLFLSGMGPRQPGTDAVPGGPVWNEKGEKQAYDVAAQTRAVIENVRTVLEASGSSLERVIDVQCFLIDMERDFEDFNRVYAETFEGIQATRTTVQVDRLPTPIAVEFKVVAACD